MFVIYSHHSNRPSKTKCPLRKNWKKSWSLSSQWRVSSCSQLQRSLWANFRSCQFCVSFSHILVIWSVHVANIWSVSVHCFYTGSIWQHVLLTGIYIVIFGLCINALVHQERLRTGLYFVCTISLFVLATVFVVSEAVGLSRQAVIELRAVKSRDWDPLVRYLVGDTGKNVWVSVCRLFHFSAPSYNLIFARSISNLSAALMKSANQPIFRGSLANR